MPITLPADARSSRRFAEQSVYGPDQCFYLVGVGAEVLRELVQIWIGDLLEPRLVDISDDLDPHPLEFRSRLPLQLKTLFWFLRADISAGGQDPLLLISAEALPQPVADPEDRVVRLMLAHGQHGRHLIVLVDEVDVDGVLGKIDDARLQRGVNAAERHVDGLRAVSREHRILGGGCLYANLQAFEILDFANLLPAVKVTETLRADPDDVDALHGAVDHIPDSFEYFHVAERLDVVILRTEQEMQRHDAGLRRDRRGVGR